MARRTPFIVATVATVAVGAGLLVPRALADSIDATWVQPSPTATGQTAQLPGGQGGGQAVSVDIDFAGEFLGWGMHDRATGAITGSNLSQTSSTESMIKTWLVADYLRQTEEPSEYHLELASQAIRWSDDNAAETLYQLSGGDASIERLISMCGLVDTTVHEGWWSRTQMSPRDVLKLAECLIDGTAAGPRWTEWLINEMRHVEGTAAPEDQERTRGGGRWGIIDGVPAESADQVALKNGWTSIIADGSWHLNCLAFTDEWTLVVMMRYPDELGLSYGVGVCENVARQLLT